jgi:hypothetical protein
MVRDQVMTEGCQESAEWDQDLASQEMMSMTPLLPPDPQEEELMK